MGSGYMALSSTSGNPATRLDDYVKVISSMLKMAISCENVGSDTSLTLCDLEQNNVTGYLCIGLEYDSENREMIINIIGAKKLINQTYANMKTLNAFKKMDTYVKMFFIEDKTINVQTKVYRKSNYPNYQEHVIFTMYPEDQIYTALLFHIYSIDMKWHTLIGEGELNLAYVNLTQPVTTWVTLTDASQSNIEFGELLFSLSYLHTAERLILVVVKAKICKLQNDKKPGQPFVEVYLLQNKKKIYEKKTSCKKPDMNPIYNEAMIFNIPAHMLQTIQICLTVSELHPETSKAYLIGHVIVGAQATGRSLAHWHQMLQALRQPVAMWHPLRKQILTNH